MAVINVSALTEELKRNRKEYQKLFKEAFATISEAKQDFTMLPMDPGEEVVLLREFLANITQPGKTGVTNFTTAISTLKQRIGKTKPIKVDLKIDELELVAIQKSYIGRKEPADPRDIHSLAGRSYLMGRISEKMQGEIVNGFYEGVHNAGTGVVGGTNLYDGFEQLFVQGYTLISGGGLEDIPLTHKVASPAAGAITSANVFDELRKMIAVITASSHLRYHRRMPGTIFCDFSIYAALVAAQEAAVSNKDQVFTKSPDGEYRSNLLPNIVLKPRPWMDGSGNMFYSVDGNLFYLYTDLETGEDPAIKFQESDRDLKVFIDAEASVDYADGRLICLYK